jgi:malate dehydrogenase (oxaloacetate-decarboxylating)(NADP+)
MSDLKKEALEFHAAGKKGKISINLQKKLVNKHDLSLAYSPGVAEPCLEISQDKDMAYKYTAKGNFVAVISNGSAVLGLGNLGALASKPVMEGKSALFKRFADIDSIDIEVNESDPEKFIEVVSKIGDTWGGINLEDIKAPECFVIEDELKKILDIPVFHDDQHGTAIVTCAGFINALFLTKRDIKDVNIVVNGAGAAAFACVDLLRKMGVKKENIIVCDSRGVIYSGRKEGMNKYKEIMATETDARNLVEAIKGADAFIGLSVKDAVSKEMVASMAPKPIIFAMANPDPEILPQTVQEVRDDAIIATGRSDFKNQVNNFICFPYLFRGALDVKATEINDEMKIAAANALAHLARLEITEEILAASGGASHKFGPDYIIPVTFDSRLIEVVSIAVAKAAIKTGVARRKIEDFNDYRRELYARLNPTFTMMDRFFSKIVNKPKNILFAEGEEDEVIKAAADWQSFGYGKSILVGREDVIKTKFKKLGVGDIEITNAAISNNCQKYIDDLMSKQQRSGYSLRDCRRAVNRDRNIFATEMLVNDEVDLLITGITRDYNRTLTEIMTVMKPRSGRALFGLNIISINNQMIFIADTVVNQNMNSEMICDIAIQCTEQVQKLGVQPRVALISASNFGSVETEESKKMKQAVELLDGKHVDFEYEGEITIDVALNITEQFKHQFSRLTGPANILIMPSVESADIAVRLLANLGEVKSIGPILCGFPKTVQILPMNASSADILNLAAIAADK